jgi:hypothetical protein
MTTLFLYDFLSQLLLNLEKTPISKTLRLHSVEKVLPEICSWIFKLSTQISTHTFRLCHREAQRIPIRGQSPEEHDFIVQRATYVRLKLSEHWLKKESEYLKTILVEAGCFHTKNVCRPLELAENFLAFLVPTCINVLHTFETPVKADPRTLSDPLDELY